LLQRERGQNVQHRLPVETSRVAEVAVVHHRDLVLLKRIVIVNNLKAVLLTRLHT
jgi:hypothetical protein